MSGFHFPRLSWGQAVSPLWFNRLIDQVKRSYNVINYRNFGSAGIVEDEDLQCPGTISHVQLCVDTATGAGSVVTEDLIYVPISNDAGNTVPEIRDISLCVSSSNGGGDSGVEVKVYCNTGGGQVLLQTFNVDDTGTYPHSEASTENYAVDNNTFYWMNIDSAVGTDLYGVTVTIELFCPFTA